MLLRLQQLVGVPIASQTYVQTQISNLIKSSPDLLNTLSELSAAINNDPNFNNTMLTLIATKAGLTSNNTFTGNNTFTRTNTNINNLYSTILSVNNNNTRRSVANYFEVGMSQTSPYVYFDNSGKFGLVNTNDSSLSWNISLSGSAIIPTINSTTGTISN